MKKLWSKFTEFFLDHQVPIYAGGVVVFVIIVIVALQ
jgi:hypothetical protein